MNNVVSGKMRIVKNSVYLYIRMFLVMILSMISVRLLLKLLGVEDYGIYYAIGGVVTSLAFVTSTLSNASQRFFSYELGKLDNGDLKRVFNTIYEICIVVSVLLLIIILLGGFWFISYKMTIPPDKINLAKIVLVFSAITFIISVLNNPFTALIIAHEDMNLYALLSMVDMIIKFGAVLILLVPLKNKIIIYSASLLIASLIYIIINYLTCRSKYKSCRFKITYEPTEFKHIFAFSGWTMFGAVAGVGYNQGFNVLLNVFIGPLANAAFAISNQLANAINTLSAGVFSAIRPSFIKSFALKDKTYSKEMFEFSNKISFILLSLLSIPIIVYTSPILRLWLGDIHEYMVMFTRFIIIAIIIQNIGIPMTAIAQGANLVKKYHICVDGFTLLSLAAIYLLLKDKWDLKYVFSTYILIFAIAHFFRLLTTRNAIDLSIRKYIINFIIPGIIIYSIAVLLSWGIKLYFGESLFSLTIGSFSSSVLTILLWCRFMLSKIELENINNKIHELYKKYVK